MRLNKKQQKLIIDKVHQVLGEDFSIKLFGSRVDASQLGGDIDLYIKTNQIIDHPARVITKIEAKLIMALGDQKIDIILDAPNLEPQPIHQIAQQTGIPLCQ